MTSEAGRRVLVVDDEPGMLRALAINLRAAGWEVRTARDGAAAIAAVAASPPDVVVLDLGLPDLDGTEVLARLREHSEMPVVVLSARHHNADKVEALDLGADDYVTKPFAMTELLARLRASVRRAQRPQESPGGVVEVGDLRVDLDRRSLTRDGADVALTPTEWGILSLLARRLGRLVTREEILREVWGPGYERETHYLRVYVAQLRRKIEVDPAAPRHLATVSGQGYILDAASSGSGSA